MHDMEEALRAAWTGIVSHGFRSFLTALGIVIGVASTIGVISIIQGMAVSITSSFDALGSNSLSIYSDTPFEDQIQGKSNRLTLADYRYLLHNLEDVTGVTPSFAPFGMFGTTARLSGHSAFTHVSAVTPKYQDTFKTYTTTGRFLDQADEQSRRKVAVIGEKLRRNLSLPSDPTGRFVEFGGQSFKIVGLMEEKGDLFGVSQDDYVLIPFSTGEALAGDAAQQDIAIALNVGDRADLDAVQDRATRLLRQSRKLAPGQRDDFKVQTAKQLADSFGQVTGTVTMVLGGVVGISLLVGGIGIMNIMLVSVKERTREIGICKALGAHRHHILTQFLLEAVILSLLGGVVGLALGAGLGWLVTCIVPSLPAATVPLWAVVTALGFSGAIGVVFGILPAAQAAGLSPIDALRYE